MTPTSPASPPRDWTPGRMAFALPASLEAYVLACSSGYDRHAAALAHETQALGDAAVMMLGKEQFALFRFFCGMLGARRALDVGTFTGMSALALAGGVGPAGKVVTLDRTRAWLDIAQRHWNAAGVADRIDVRTGEAIDVLQALRAAGEAPFDIAFLDVDKARIADYLFATLDLMAPRGLVIVDNAAWHGWVLDNDRTDPDTVGMRELTRVLAADATLEAVMLPVADGMMLVRRRTA